MFCRIIFMVLLVQVSFNLLKALPKFQFGDVDVKSDLGAVRSNNESNVILHRERRIVGGDDANYNVNFTFVASIWLDGTHKCGGTYIRRFWILTSAKCMTDGRGRIYDVRQIKVRMGHQQLSKLHQAESRYVTKICIHKGFVAGNRFSHNIALLLLASPFPIAEPSNIVNLPVQWVDYEHVKECCIVGWGSPGLGEEYSDRLQLILVPIVNSVDCKDMYAASGLKHVDIDPYEVICAGKLKQTACDGDFGGPLLCKIGAKYWHQVGIMSWYYGNCSGAFPSAFIRVDAYLKWINRTIDKNAPSDFFMNSSKRLVSPSRQWLLLLTFIIVVGKLRRFACF